MQTLALTCSRVALVVLLVTGYGCGARPEASRDAQATNRPGVGPPFQRVRAPAVAGLFYPGDAAALSKTIDGLLAKAPDHFIPRLKALVCPTLATSSRDKQPPSLTRCWPGVTCKLS